MKTETEMKEQIERTRKLLYRRAASFGLQHPAVLRCSERLDRQLQAFYTTFMKKPVSRLEQA